MNLKKISFLIFISFLMLGNVKSQDKQEDKIEASVKVVDDFSKMKESIPAQLLKVTEGIIIIPHLIKAGFVLAGKRGKGIAMVKLEDGTWSNPAFITITGGSLGFQAGVESVDLILIFKSRETLQKLGKGSFTLGGDISVTAGPVGRNSSASTDYKLKAEVYSYSRSKGLFAGISLSGSALDVDEKANEAYYNEETDSKTLFSDASKDTSAETKTLKDKLTNFYK